MTAPPVLVEVHRGPTVESRHRGHIVEVDATGRVIRAAGTPDVAITLRATVKPFAAVALVESGAADALGLTSGELAILTSSHTGEDKHVRTLQALFRRASVSQAMLRCGTDGAPADAITAARLVRDGETPSPLRHGCSGFHAASLLLSAHAGWSLDDYADPAHPSQVAVREIVARIFGVAPGALRTSPDDCGLLTYEVPLVALARAYLLLADPDTAGLALADGRPPSMPTAALRRIRDAMMAAPDMVGGSYDNLDTQLMRRRPGRLVSKAGADGLRAVGFVPLAGAMDPGATAGETGTAAGAMAIKVEDGDLSRRAIKAASVEALAQIGVLDERDTRALVDFHRPIVQTPDGREAATSVPRFELAPLGELA
jgi:L-asparaginase II